MVPKPVKYYTYIDVGQAPGWVGYSYKTHEIYASTAYTLTVINGTTVLKTISFGTTALKWILEDMTYDQSNHNMYVVGYNNSNGIINSKIFAVSPSNKVIKTIGLPSGAASIMIAYDPFNKDVYVPSSGFDTNPSYIYVIDPSSNSIVSTINIGPNTDPCCGIAFNPMNNAMYITDDNQNVWVINSTTNSIINKIQIPSSEFSPQPAGIAYSPITHEMYVANQGNGVVSVISGLKVVQNITLVECGCSASGLYQVTYDSADKSIWVDNLDYVNITVISSSNTPVQSFVNGIFNGNTPAGMVYNPENKMMYVASPSSDTVTVYTS